MSEPSHGPEAGAELGLSQMLRKLAQRSCSVVAAAAIMPGRSSAPPLTLVKDGRPAGFVVRADFDRARRAGFVEHAPDGTGWRLSAKGRDAVRRLTSGAVERETTPPGDGRPGFNADESPLGWLRRRRGKDGVALISDAQFQAGERLRADFSFAQLGPRVTANWDAALGAASGGRRSAAGCGVEITDSALAARERVNRALAAVGPELAGILVDVCCFLKGLEDAERSVGWPQRSGKVVLQIALTSLARHYGLSESGGGGANRARGPRHWGAPDYRPSIHGAGDDSGVTGEPVQVAAD
jgi:hypothetical protein